MDAQVLAWQVRVPGGGRSPYQYGPTHVYLLEQPQEVVVLPWVVEAVDVQMVAQSHLHLPYHLLLEKLVEVPLAL